MKSKFIPWLTRPVVVTSSHVHLPPHFISYYTSLSPAPQPDLNYYQVHKCLTLSYLQTLHILFLLPKMLFPIYPYDSLPQVSAQMSLFQRKLNLPFFHEIGFHPLSTLHPLCPALCFFGAVMAIDVYVSTRANLLQSCLTLCNPMDDSPLGFPIPGILQARTLERVAISLSNA